MTVRLEEFASPDALPADTGGLFAASPGLFHSRAWWRTVTAFGMPGQTRPCFLLARTGDTPAALFALCRPDSGGALTSLTTPYTCEYTPLLAPGLSAAAQAETFAAFARFCRGWATTRLDALPEDWPALPACVDGARAAGLAVVRFAHFGNWREDVRGLDWAGYLARRPGALRETIRRKLRRATQRKDANFTIITHPMDLQAGIDAFEQVYARSWKDPEPFPHFNAGLMRETAAAGLLRLGIWRIGGTPVAAQLWILELGTATVLKLAHDEAFHADSPGTVLTALMLRTLLDGAQVDTIDFGRGDDAYKQGWASQRRQRIGVVLVNPRRPAGMAFLARHKLGRARGWLQAWRPRIAGGPRAVRQPDALEQLPQRQAVRSCASTSRVMPITGSSARWQAPIGIHDCRHAGGKVVGHEPSSAMTTGRGDPGSSRIVAFAGAPRLAGVTQHGER